jgi:hypothetical protein
MMTIDHIKTRVMLPVGLAALVSGAFMSFSFGASMSLAHGVTLFLLTFVAAFMFPLIDHLKAAGASQIKTGALTAVAVVFLLVELFSHVGYTVGTRVENAEMTGIQNTKYTDTREAVVDHKANLAMWKERLAKLTEQNGWAATTTAEALRAQLETAQKAIDLEAARGGCKSRCLAEMDKKAKLEAQIAIAEERKDLTKQITATQALIDKSREKASVTEYKSSPIVNQTKFVAQLTTLSLEPGAAPLTWVQIAIGMLVALVTTFLPPYVFELIFGVPHKADAPKLTTGFTRGRAPDAETAARKPGQALVIERRMDDTEFVEAVAAATRRQS